MKKEGENVWIAKSAKVAPTAYINGPAIIGKKRRSDTVLFIRGNAIVGGRCRRKFHRTEKCYSV